MFPIDFHLRIHLSEDEDLHLSFHSIRPDRILFFAAKTKGKGTIIHNSPKGWVIRRDPQDDAFIGQPKHYHCKKGSKEIVITHEGFGSHKTTTGDEIPKKLGDFLERTIGIDVKRDMNGRHVIRLEIIDYQYPCRTFEPEDLLEDLLNHWYVIPDIETI